MSALKMVRGWPACLLWVLIAGHALRANAPAADEPHLVFKKTVAVREYGGGRAYASPYSIKEGDHLWKIMREQYHLSDREIAQFVQIAREVNPNVADLDTLEPRQQIMVPFKYVPWGAVDNATVVYPDQDVTVVVAEGEHLAKLLRTRYRLPDSIIFSRHTYRLLSQANPGITNLDLLEKGHPLVIPAGLFARAGGGLSGKQPSAAAYAGTGHSPPPAGPLLGPRAATGAEQRARSALSALTGAFDGTVMESGQAVLPLSGRGAVTLDYATYPVYLFPWGKKIMLDYGGRLNEDVRQVIAAAWDSTGIVAVFEDEDLESTLARAIDAGGFFQVERQADYIAKQGPVQISVRGDWIICQDRMMKDVVVVSLVSSGQATISPALRGYLTGMGLHMVDIAADGVPQAVPPPRAPAENPAEQLLSGPAQLADLILSAGGISYREDYRTDIFQNRYSGLSLEITLDRMFEKSGIIHGIQFHALPDTIADIILQQGVQLLQIEDGRADAADSAAAIARFCGIDHQPSPAVVRFIHGDRAGVTLTIPGTLVGSAPGQLLIAQGDLDPGVVAVAAAEGIHVLKPW